MKKLKVYDVEGLNSHLERVYQGEHKDDLVVVIDSPSIIKINKDKKKYRMWFLVSKRTLENPINLNIKNKLGIKLSDILESINNDGIAKVHATHHRRLDYYEFISLPGNIDLNLYYIPKYGFVWYKYHNKIPKGLIEDYSYMIQEQFYLPSIEAAVEYIWLRNIMIEEELQKNR